jgi:Na+/H+-dicarboxylate symporter
MTPRTRRGTVRMNRAVPWRTRPHPWFAFWVLFALVLGVAVGLFIGPHHGTEPPPSTSYSRTYQ